MATDVDQTYLAAGSSAAQDRRWWMGRQVRSAGIFVLSLAIGLAVWQLISLQYDIYFFPSPADAWTAFRELAADGTLASSTIDSARRILIGWVWG